MDRHPRAHHGHKGHGRVERRTIRVQPAPEGIAFPYTAQVFLVERYVTDTASGKHSAVAVLGVTSLATTRASAADIASHVRKHWRIENKLHYVRDVTYGEDASRVRTGNGPRVMASFRIWRSASSDWPGTPTSLPRSARPHARPPGH